jgi:hypothetical protein
VRDLRAKNGAYAVTSQARRPHTVRARTHRFELDMRNASRVAVTISQHPNLKV